MKSIRLWESVTTFATSKSADEAARFISNFYKEYITSVRIPGTNNYRLTNKYDPRVAA